MKTSIENLSRSLPTASPLSNRTIRTLLAEDEPALLALLARIASRDQRVAIFGSATDGCKAVCIASMLQPDLVITDLHLPGLDGAQVTRLLKQLPDPPTIFIATSDITPEARARCRAAGADAFVAKVGNFAPRLHSTIQEFFPEDPEPSDAESAQTCESLATIE
jgi:CheY-like chemotaxis protein